MYLRIVLKDRKQAQIGKLPFPAKWAFAGKLASWHSKLKRMNKLLNYSSFKKTFVLIGNNMGGNWEFCGAQGKGTSPGPRTLAGGRGADPRGPEDALCRGHGTIADPTWVLHGT